MTPEDTRAWAEFYAAMTRLGLDPDVEAGHWPPAAPDTTPGPSTGLAVDFFIDAISQAPETHRDVVLVHAISTIVAVYTWAALAPR
ncbi:hypothetical protein ACFORJ_01620 [Corynebacterium hansenii]|uniref:Uncharacterized protein n=1 Tax=Corynebacterium hansenii TaxID=394964 RepID=A0ABV7ZN14_9CORY|nr:hypothetical protein [Corynebacterium hansenii]WJY99302.1 hypothetical protein CHAN_03370 [Corynebacterium hansenii]